MSSIKDKIDQSLEKMTEGLTGEMVILEETMTIKYEIGKQEYLEMLSKGDRVDKRIVYDKEFQYKYFKLMKIIEGVGCNEI